MAANGAPNDSATQSDKPVTLTMLGCGTLGLAILSGILASLTEVHSTDSNPTTSTKDSTPSKTPTKFIACVRRPQSAKRIQDAISQYPDTISGAVRVLQNDNIAGVEAADIIILGCKPYMVKDILRSKGMREALQNKLLISICAGLTVPMITESLYGSVDNDKLDDKSQRTTKIVRVMPNTAAVVRESMTVIANSDPPLSEDIDQVLEWIFTRVGKVVRLPPAMMDVSTALCGSGPAFLALVMEALADGALAMGLPRAEAQLMAAQTMRGTAGMVLAGEHPALVREKVSTPGGCTIGGLLVLEEGGVRGAVSRGIREATCVASELGKGASGVNGTRH